MMKKPAKKPAASEPDASQPSALSDEDEEPPMSRTAVMKRPVVVLSNEDEDADPMKKPAAKGEDPYAEAKRDYGRLNTALAKSSAARQKWDEIQALPRGGGKNAKKQVFMFAWKEGLLKDNTPFGESFWEEVSEIETSDKRTLGGVWVSRGRLATLIGHDEASQQIANKELKEKKKQPWPTTLLLHRGVGREIGQQKNVMEDAR